MYFEGVYLPTYLLVQKEMATHLFIQEEMVTHPPTYLKGGGPPPTYSGGDGHLYSSIWERTVIYLPNY